MDRLVKAQDVCVGDLVYNNRTPNWLERWPTVTMVEPISAGRLAIHTTNRLFIAKPTELILSKSV